MQGKQVTLSAQRGKVVFLDFWATWCPPCRKSIPAVEALAEKYKGKNVVFYGVNIENDAAAVKKFFANKAVPYTIIIGNEDIAGKYKVRGIPAFFIVNPEGKIAQRYVGYQPGMESNWEKTIQELLNASSPMPNKNSSTDRKRPSKQ
jgi:thiol-disulfide isomerase/thioredoxin